MSRKLFIALLLLCACGTSPRQAASVETATPTPPEAATVEAAPSDVESIALTRAAHVDMTEVVLDPRGESALTLDRDGGVRLWPAIRVEKAATPWVLPMQEPAWMSLARAGDDGFVVAHIDTTSGGHVGRVEITDDGARFVPLFDVPPSDPLFELWVLEGGKRILALGIDHRVRLYDAAGTMLSVIDQAAFVPWQLRVVQTPGQPVAIAAVLARSTRAQRIRLEDDALSLVGEAHMVALDQSPNRNDLELAPDGRTIGALRRPKHRGATWWLELIDLDTGERRKITGEADANVRPRLHLLEGERALLHAGTGKAQRVDLTAARKVVIGEVPPPPSEFAAAIETLDVPALAGERRMQTTMAAGLLAVVDGAQLTADPIDDASTFVHRAQRFHPHLGAVSPDGDRVVWADGRELYLEESDGEVRELTGADETVMLVEFIDDAHWLVVSHAGTATIRSGETGAVGATMTVRSDRSGFRAVWDGDDTLTIAGKDGAMHAVTVRDGAFSDPIAVSDDREASARAIGIEKTIIAAQAIDGSGRRFVATKGDRPALHRVDGSTVERLRLRAGAVERVFTAGDLVAVAQWMPDTAVTQDSMFSLSVYDGTTATRLWTRPLTGPNTGSFSRDGNTLVLADAEGGVLVDARTGAIARRRSTR